MLSICTDKGYRFATRDELRVLPTPEPTTTWRPIPHAELADRVHAGIRDLGYAVTDEQIAVSPDGQACLGGFVLNRDHHWFVTTRDRTEGMSGAVLWRHDNKKVSALQLAVGGRVWACANGMLSASWQVRHKHVPGVDDWLARELERVPELLSQQDEQVARMRRSPCFGPYADAALVRLGRRGVLPWRLVGLAADELNSPEHARKHGAGTRWSWYNAVTEAAKRASPARQLTIFEEAWKIALN